MNSFREVDLNIQQHLKISQINNIIFENLVPKKNIQILNNYTPTNNSIKTISEIPVAKNFLHSSFENKPLSIPDKICLPIRLEKILALYKNNQNIHSKNMKML